MFLTYILSPIYHLYYLFVLCVFHPITAFSLKRLGHKSRVIVIAAMNYLLQKGVLILGCRVKVKGKENLPNADRPLIIVSNHQALYDIPIIGSLFSLRSVEFVAKSSLSKGIPTISYNLRNGKSALVDRENGGQSVREIFKLGKYVQANKFAVCIFPEGTRTKTGEVNEFMPAGVASLLRAAPDALILPFAIKGHYDLTAKSSVWLKVGQKLEYTIFPVIDPKGLDMAELMQKMQGQITEAVNS